jgi:hypothetical protein
MLVVEVVETILLIVQDLGDQVVVEQVQQDLAVLQQEVLIEALVVAVVDEAQVVLFQIMELMVVQE